MENSSVLIKSLPCRPAWMNLEDIELRGYSQSLKDTIPKKSKMVKLMEAKSGMVVVEMKGRLNWESLIKGL